MHCRNILRSSGQKVTLKIISLACIHTFTCVYTGHLHIFPHPHIGTPHVYTHVPADVCVHTWTPAQVPSLTMCLHIYFWAFFKYHPSCAPWYPRVIMHWITWHTSCMKSHQEPVQHLVFMLLEAWEARWDEQPSQHSWWRHGRHPHTGGLRKQCV